MWLEIFGACRVLRGKVDRYLRMYYVHICMRIMSYTMYWYERDELFLKTLTRSVKKPCITAAQDRKALIRITWSKFFCKILAICYLIVCASNRRFKCWEEACFLFLINFFPRRSDTNITWIVDSDCYILLDECSTLLSVFYGRVPRILLTPHFILVEHLTYYIILF